MTSRILVVDDLEPNIRLLSAMLTLEYYSVIPATSGEAAIELAHQHNPDVILLDVMMPGLDGFETCRRLKADAATRHIPVVMVTALDQREDRVRGLEVGADDFLTKPVDDFQLMARVKSLSRFKIVLDELRAREASGRKLGVIEGDGPQAEAGLGARVLIVDDNPKQAERIRRALEADQRPILMHEAAGLGPAGQATVELMIVSAAARSFDGLRVCAQAPCRSCASSIPMTGRGRCGRWKWASTIWFRALWTPRSWPPGCAPRSAASAMPTSCAHRSRPVWNWPSPTSSPACTTGASWSSSSGP
jgi:two-component system cell cycle response regulator